MTDITKILDEQFERIDEHVKEGVSYITRATQSAATGSRSMAKQYLASSHRCFESSNFTSSTVSIVLSKCLEANKLPEDYVIRKFGECRARYCAVVQKQKELESFGKELSLIDSKLLEAYKKTLGAVMPFAKRIMERRRDQAGIQMSSVDK